MSDDFCLIHGYEHMERQFGNPVTWCAQCERDRGDPLTSSHDALATASSDVGTKT